MELGAEAAGRPIQRLMLDLIDDAGQPVWIVGQYTVHTPPDELFHLQRAVDRVAEHLHAVGMRLADDGRGGPLSLQNEGGRLQSLRLGELLLDHTTLDQIAQRKSEEAAAQSPQHLVREGRTDHAPFDPRVIAAVAFEVQA